MQYFQSYADDDFDVEDIEIDQDTYEALCDKVKILVSHFNVGSKSTQPPSYEEEMIPDDKSDVSTSSDVGSDSDVEASSTTPDLYIMGESREEPKYINHRPYMVACKDPKKGFKHTEELEGFLKALVPHDKIQEMLPIKNDAGKTLGWGGVFLDEKGRSAADNHPDLMKLSEDFEMELCATSVGSSKEKVTTIRDNGSNEAPRRWIRQANADPALVTASQYQKG